MTEVLQGVRVVELGTMITAPLAGMMLADLGAEVIKIEHPQGGDPFRSFRGGQYSPHFVAYNRGKRSMQLDLRNKAGAAVLRKLLARSDILLENYRAGVMDRLGFGAEALAATNPKLIHCSITGFGASGPYSGRPAYDSVGLALSGIASLFLDPDNPQACGPTIPDNATGMFACCGILGALYERERTGRGRRVEVNMLEAAISFIPDPFANHTQMGIWNDPLTRVASSHSFAFRCADGNLLAVHLSSQEKFWEGMLTAIGRTELATDERFAVREARIKNYVALTQVLAETFATKPRFEWMTQLEAEDVPFAPVHNIPEVIDDPQIKHLETFRTLRHPTEGDIVSIRRPVRIDGGRDGSDLPAPTLGQHTNEVLLELGYDRSGIGELRAEAVI
ncbi:MAG: CaiB/BaiF CoA-transferase family protein [Alphaproteobacteria bacterium]|nr:CaiB/BaiF CoA-transferase family protein [Alphaproteobacteria bacterium]